MRYANDLDRVQEGIHAALNCVVNREEFVKGDWLDPKHRCGDIVKMMQDGVPDDEIKHKYSGLSADVLAVYHRIADGTLEELEPKPQSEKALKKAKERERERKAAYMRKYGHER